MGRIVECMTALTRKCYRHPFTSCGRVSCKISKPAQRRYRELWCASRGQVTHCQSFKEMNAFCTIQDVIYFNEAFYGLAGQQADAFSLDAVVLGENMEKPVVARRTYPRADLDMIKTCYLSHGCPQLRFGIALGDGQWTSVRE